MSNISFPSSGDPEKDAETAKDIERSFALRAQGRCPNDETQMIMDAPNERHCPKCGFVDWSNVPFPSPDQAH